MDITWSNNVDQALAEAKARGRALFLDFNAAPL